LSLANAILSATSQGKPFVDAAWIQPDTIVCDAARPGDVGEHVRRQRGDLFVFDGGLVRLPEPVRFGRNNVLGFEAGINLACLSETMALTMEQVTRHHSLGRRIALEEARAIKAMAVRHGFSCHLPEPHAALLAGAESLLGSDHGLATL
jgi:predicted amino acid dehydrogenase